MAHLPLVFLLFMKILLPVAVVQGCDARDRAALISIKNSFNFDTWSDENTTASASDCCTWTGITCNKVGRVNSFQLPPNSNSFDPDKNSIPKAVCQLVALEKLVLSFEPLFKVALAGIIPKCIGTSLPQLRYFSLYHNNLVGRIPRELGLLTKLEHLDLSENNLGGGIPKELCKLKKLRFFSLARGANHRRSTHPQGSIPACFTDLVQLQILDLNRNFFTGHIPEQLGNLVNLKRLILEGNSFSGPIPSSIGRLAQLEVIRLEGEGMEMSGPFPENFANLSKLKEVWMESIGRLTGAIPDFSRFKDLELLRIINCSLGGQLPSVFPKGKLERLEQLFISDNSITGTIPDTFSDNLPGVKYLYLKGNRLTGNIPSSFGKFRAISTVDLSFNSLNGQIPESLGELTGDDFAVDLDLASNNLSGVFPLSLCKLGSVSLSRNKLSSLSPGVKSPPDGSRMRSLDVSFNELSGRIPGWLGRVKSLRELDLSHNKLTGRIPAQMGKLSLSSLHLSDNLLTGPIPAGLSQITDSSFGNNTGLCNDPLPPCK